MDRFSSLRASIIDGIPKLIPDHPGIDQDLDHVPVRRQVLSSDEKRLALRNALRYFPIEHHEILADDFAY